MSKLSEELIKELKQFYVEEKENLSYDGFRRYLRENIKLVHSDSNPEGSFGEKKERAHRLTALFDEIKQKDIPEEIETMISSAEQERHAEFCAFKYKEKCEGHLKINPWKKAVDMIIQTVYDIDVTKDLLESKAPCHSGKKIYYDGYFFTDNELVNGKVVIKKDVETIPAAAFKHCFLEELVLEEGVKYIQNGECYQSYDPKKRTGDTGCHLESKEGYKARRCCGAFCKCHRLSLVTVPKSLEDISNYAFQKCSNLTSVEGLKDSHVSWIGWSAFQECTKLQKIEFPPTLLGIGCRAFQCCRSLCSIVLEGTQVTKIPDAVFKDCDKLEKVILPSGLKKIDYLAFANTALSEIFLPESVDMIQPNAFEGCMRLKKIYIKNTLQKELLEKCYIKENGIPLTGQAEIMVNVG